MQVYLVGGAVRDRLLGKQVHDQDFVVVGSCVDEMLAAGFSQVGADFPVFLHPHSKQEYALARSERKTGQGHQGFSIDASTEVTLAEDLLRRDLTINALAMQVHGLFDDTPCTGEVIDHYGGLDDLHHKTLRHISAAFAEDPLRVLRVARFASRLYDEGFGIADSTLDMMQAIVAHDELSQLSRERIWQESSRAMMQANPQVYWQVLSKVGALAAEFAPLDRAWQYPQIQSLICAALKQSARWHLTLEQRWAVLMTSFDITLDADPDAELDTPPTDTTAHQYIWLDAIQRVHQQHRIPKTVEKFAKLYAKHAEPLQRINSLNAEQLISLIQSTAAHKQPQIIDELLTVTALLSMTTQQQRLQQALASYQAISIDDIDASLKGPQIGHALTARRIEHLQQQLR